MTNEVDLYEGCGSHSWTWVMTCCLTFLLKIYTDFRGGLLADKGMWHIVAFHIFWMESIRLASTLLMPRLWYKARGCYPSPRLRSQFNTQLIAFLASCVLLNNTLRITLRWENSSPYLVPDGNIEHLKIARERAEWNTWYCIAYFVHDTIHMLASWEHTKMKSMLVHHIYFFVISAGGTFATADEDVSAVNALFYTPVIIFALQESSTIFLSTRWFIIKVLYNGKPGSSKPVKIFLTIMEYLFLLCFIVFRYVPILLFVIVPYFIDFLKYSAISVSYSHYGGSNSFMGLNYSFPLSLYLLRLLLHGCIFGLVFLRFKEVQETGYLTVFTFIGLSYFLNMYWALDSVSTMIVPKNKKAKPL